jgi:hypothetical protein
MSLDPIDITQQLAEKGITLYSVGCEPAILPYRDFFMALAYKTGGQYTINTHIFVASSLQLSFSTS